MEKRAIVYSYNKRGSVVDGFNNSYHYEELLYSVSTIRKYNKHIPIYIYLSPIDVLEYTDKRVDKLFVNVHIKYFTQPKPAETEWPVYYLEKQFWDCLQHRWKNAIYSLIDNDLDRILFLDADTVIHDDIDNLFNIYADHDTFYALEDCTHYILEKLKITHPELSLGMNDGQFILSKKIVNKLLPNFFKDHNEIIINLLTKTKYLMTEKEHVHLHWLAGQYALYLLLKKYDISFKIFDNKYVKWSTQPEYQDTSNMILHHYFSGNKHLYLKSI